MSAAGRDTARRSLLVTGGAGFIGSNFVHYWRAAHPGDRVVVLDALTYAGNLHNLALADDATFRFVRGDIADAARVESLLREERIDTLVNFAAESHVDRSIAGPGAFIQTNVVGTHALLASARQVWRDATPRPHRFHHVSTDEVYGSIESDAPASCEGDAYAPNSPYAASKAASDHLVRAYARTYGLEVTTSNCCNNYGPRQFPEKLIPLAIVRVLTGRPVPIYGDGHNQRDWLHVRDHCRGLELVLEKGVPGEVYHLGGGESAENLDLVRALCDSIDSEFARNPALAGRFPAAPPARGAKSEVLIELVTDRPGHDRRYAVDGGKARRELGFSAEVALTQGLADTVAWYLANESWWSTHR
jgi:dTDP-glucose 4,6-dehydratase